MELRKRDRISDRLLSKAVLFVKPIFTKFISAESYYAGIASAEFHQNRLRITESMSDISISPLSDVRPSRSRFDRQAFVKNFCTEININQINGLVRGSRSETDEQVDVVST
jgi:hypothetical protein